jgi:hypothetical protein
VAEECAAAEWEASTAAGWAVVSAAVQSVSRAMENCPLGATRNRPLLG